jgi:hypothetical protein
MSEDVAAATTVPGTAAETSPDNPWPLQLLSQKLKMHIDRAPSAWVEGQVIELNRRGTNAYLTLRDIDAEISLPASAWTKVLDRQEIPLERGSRVVALIKAEKGDRWGNLTYRMSARNFGPVMASAARFTVATVHEIVELGQLDPESVVTPGIYVSQVVKIERVATQAGGFKKAA